MNKEQRIAFSRALKNMSKKELKMLYDIIVYYWVDYRYFISKQNFFNLWCELNFYCYLVDKSFPSPYDDRELMKSYCQEHPFYFIDILDSELVINLFCQHFNHNVDVLIGLAQRLDTRGLRAAYEFIIKEFEMVDNDINKLIKGTQERVKAYS